MGSSKPEVLLLNLTKCFILKLLLLILFNGQVKVCHPQTDTLYRVHNGRNCQFQTLSLVLGVKGLVLAGSACKHDVDSILMVSLWHSVDHLFPLL